MHSSTQSDNASAVSFFASLNDETNFDVDGALIGADEHVWGGDDFGLGGVGAWSESYDVSHLNYESIEGKFFLLYFNLYFNLY